ncbi:Paxillin [Mizuhopecten yessoensis]|uniref:Paxillin n=1 Tax=Mizuhopecten yessoensis TaxID=6573 RepID=A0A210R313_MIZYE|nr:Paxillin [Mizuhopecten yessoensis]
MQNYKQRVMEDLDALLADLQSTTAQINQYQHQSPAPRTQSPPAQQLEQRQQYQQQQQQQQQEHYNHQPPQHLQRQYSDQQNCHDGAYDHQQITNSNSYEHRQVPQSLGYNNRQLPQSPGYDNRQVQQSPGYDNRQVQQSVGYDNRQVQQSPGYDNRQVQQSPGYDNRQVQHSSGYDNRQVQHSPGYEQQQFVQRQHSYQSQSSHHSAGHRSETPPPLPPPPPQEVLDSIPPPRQFDEPLYEGQSVTVIRDQTPSSGTSRSSDPYFDNKSLASPPAPKQMSTLTNNLSELDQLLQDLNSAQFMAEVDKRNVSNQHIVNGGGGGNGGNGGKARPPPPVAPKPARNENRNTVDNLLDQLESALPERANSYKGPEPGDSDNYEYTPDQQQTAQTHTVNNVQSHQVNSIQRCNQSNMVATPQQLPPPSTATRELDDLMATLSEFKVSNTQQRQQQMSMPHARSPSPHSEPSYARPQKSRNASQGSAPPTPAPQPTGYGGQLESMLGDLESDMNRQGVSTTSKGTCGACNQQVVGQVWHIEHFICSHCNLPLGTKNFYERDGGAYCEEDYHRLFAPKCAYCNGPIVDKCVTAIGKTWHPEHFFCAQCGRPFGEEGFHEKDNNAYCRQDYLEMFAPRCGGCGNPILDNYISALSRHWHPECFVCRECHMSFGGRSFFDHEGQPYCETHYHLKRGSLCASCQKPITGRCITAMFKKFHPEHFVCAFCLKQLNKGTFKEQNDKPYCHPCFVKLFG